MRTVTGLVLAALLLQACAAAMVRTEAPQIDEVIDFAARELDAPRPAKPSIWFYSSAELRRICRSDWGCQAVDQVYLRDYCRDRMYVSMCQFALVHEIAHYVLRSAGTYKGRRRLEEPLAYAVAHKWLNEKLRGAAANPQ